MPPVGHPLRARAIGLYKDLHRLGRGYPDPDFSFIPKLRAMFRKNAHLTDSAEIESKLALAEFVRKGTHTVPLMTETESMRRRWADQSTVYVEKVSYATK
ncbi:hypothetical protein MVES1_001082 [Malassezia vespertilionis]|uniref:uncharacterized protein n=1 Tax=Malassezia vespertilionis TaxID=2020962 RepID=UPI0024B06137|nr:uncharacterized protein MVES1_001082 [Malassezia vespertilionis]WFD05749.1 hypothetical protein MVES1_001082 [Malassezia vespertilionis]